MKDEQFGLKVEEAGLIALCLSQRDARFTPPIRRHLSDQAVSIGLIVVKHKWSTGKTEIRCITDGVSNQGGEGCLLSLHLLL